MSSENNTFSACPVCSTELPLNWMDSDIEAISEGFCSCNCMNAYTSVVSSEVWKHKNPALLAIMDKNLIALSKKFHSCECCNIPLTPRRVKTDTEIGGSLIGCGNAYGLNYRQLPSLLVEAQDRIVLVCEDCYYYVDQQCERRAVDLDIYSSYVD